MYRLVDNLKYLLSLSIAVPLAAASAIVFFGAPPTTIFFAWVGLLALGAVASFSSTRRELMRKR